MPEEFDAVIVGSGFGGSVMAYELASGGLRTCLLERGKRYPPASFARAPYRMAKNFWDPSDGLFGLFDVWSFQHSEALVSAGLGGGSLIYANVLLRKPEEWFRELDPNGGGYRPWIIQRNDLEAHYDAVEEVIGANPYPSGFHPYDKTSKTIAFDKAAAAINHPRVTRTPLNIAVTFSQRPGAPPVVGEPIYEAQPNIHNKTRQTCRLCGECDVGCNYGSKNTLDYNYLTLAQRRGCDIRDLCEVKQLRPLEDGRYEVTYVKHDVDLWEGKKKPRGYQDEFRTIHTKYLVLSAGTLGSTYLLLKNKERFPRLSNRLGSRFSTNGDLLTFALRCCEQKREPKVIDPSRGPVITTGIRVDLDDHRGFFLQDAGYPEFMNWLAEVADVSNRFTRFARYAWRRIVDWVTREPNSEIDGQMAELLGPCHLSSGSLPLLGMGRDTPSGQMSLRRSGRDGKMYLQVDWKRHESDDYFDAVTTVSKKMAGVLGGEFFQNPDTQYLGRLVTVHPLGGCPMGADANDGVVNSYGEVFDYPQLYVADGAVMPGPVGANPSLTIAATSRRAAHHILGSRNQSATSTLHAV
jgi:cholesterol oxidase